MPIAVRIASAVADALEHRVGAEAAGQLLDALDRLLAALADDVGGAELAGERDPVGVAAQDDDLLGAEALGGDHAAQADGAVADDGDAILPGATPATTAAWWPVPITSESVSSDGMQRVVLADGERERASRRRRGRARPRPGLPLVP